MELVAAWESFCGLHSWRMGVGRDVEGASVVGGGVGYVPSPLIARILHARTGMESRLLLSQKADGAT